MKGLIPVRAEIVIANTILEKQQEVVGMNPPPLTTQQAYMLANLIFNQLVDTYGLAPSVDGVRPKTGREGYAVQS